MLYYSFSAWGQTHLKDAPQGDGLPEPFNAMIQDGGALLPIGRWMGLRVGFLQVRQPGFTMKQAGMNEHEVPIQTVWKVEGFRDQRWYVAWEIDIGGY
jgi:hypothetical protein